MIRINLLPDVILKQRQEKRIQQLANLGLGAWVGFLVVILLFAFGFRAFQTLRLNRANTALAEINAEVNSPENVAFRAEAQAVQESLNTLSSLFMTQQLPSEFLEVLAANTPAGVQLVELSLRDGNNITITGRAASYAEVSLFVAALKNAQLTEEDAEDGFDQKYFSFVELAGANLADENRVNFEVSASYEGNAGFAGADMDEIGLEQ